MPMARNPENARHTVSVRLPADLIEALDAAATERTLGRNKLVELMLAAGLARLAPPSLDPAEIDRCPTSTEDDCPVEGRPFSYPHFHRDGLDGEEVVRLRDRHVDHPDHGYEDERSSWTPPTGSRPDLDRERDEADLNGTMDRGDTDG